MWSLIIKSLVITCVIGTSIGMKLRKLDVWFGEDVETVASGVSDVFPYSYSAIHSPDGTVNGSLGPDDGPVCGADVFIALLTCLGQFCQSAVSDIEAVIACSLQNCLPQMTAVIDTSTDDCLQCFISLFPNILDFFSSCAMGDPSVLKKINTFGLMMVSRKRLSRKKTVGFFPKVNELIPRGYLSAKVAGRVNAVCTHLSAVANEYPEIGLFNRFSSYEEQQLYEIGRMVKKFSQKNNVLLLGDFNTGPAGGADGYLPKVENNYIVLNSSFTTQLADGCTFCPESENVYNSVDKNYVIDHVFATNLEISRVRRVFTTAESSYHVNGTQFPMSDHFGVAARVTRKRS